MNILKLFGLGRSENEKKDSKSVTTPAEDSPAKATEKTTDKSNVAKKETITHNREPGKAATHKSSAARKKETVPDRKAGKAATDKSSVAPKEAITHTRETGDRVGNYRKEFMGNVYHELKTPIFNIQGYILTLLNGGLDDPSINRLYLERCVTNINRMITIVEDLETISRLETEIIAMKKGKFDLRRMVEEVLESNELRAGKKKIKLSVSSPGNDEVMVYADKKRIYQVISNLIINSINYGTDGGRTKVRLTPKGKLLLVEVEDNGMGIDESDIKRIFERFYRIDKSRSRDSGGTGLGLAIVKHIVEAHNQKVTVKSTPGKGTTFSFTLDR